MSGLFFLLPDARRCLPSIGSFYSISLRQEHNLNEAQHPLNALPRGYRLQEYELTEVLGTGGFGITYLGFDHNLD